MTTLLQVNASLSPLGQSDQLADRFVAAWHASHPDAQVSVRDLSAQPLAHLSADEVGAFFTPADARSTEQQALVAVSDALVDELRAADVLVLGVPMYNFGIPSTLKAYFDRLARAGVTFKYTETGPVGLLTGKKAYVLAARGGMYQDTPKDSQTAYLKDFLSFIGIDDVTFVYAEGLNMGEAGRDAALAAAHQQIAQLTA
ncbi:MAG: hypothetical protein RI925_2215 [Pseudomonadota bacterium]|jgi:FMN-dependent NADH-azoreductase